MRAAQLAACAAELLGPLGGPIAVACPGAPRLARAVAARVGAAPDKGPAAGAVVAFLGAPADPAGRQAVLARLAARLAPGGPLVLLDHNQPRTWWRRAVARMMLASAGFGPARARYPAARELAALGFHVERLRLACGERVQLVLGTRA